VFPQQGLNAAERELVRLYRSLSAGDRNSLSAFGAFLVQRAEGAGVEGASEQRVSQYPIPVDRPGGESVIAALKRLRGVYPMVERGALLHEASSLMSTHVLQGRPAAEVIDELEALFARHYAAYRDAHDNRSGD